MMIDDDDCDDKVLSPDSSNGHQPSCTKVDPAQWTF